MRTLKLQMDLSLDGFSNLEAAGKNFKWGNDVTDACVDISADVDAILLGRKTAAKLIPFWDEVALNKKHKDYALGKRISELPKIVFSNTLKKSKWKNTTIISGNINKEVKKLKKIKGENLLVYGGISFAAKLIEKDLVDSFYFFKNPFCLGKGLSVFSKGILTFKLEESRNFDCGTVLLSYKRTKPEK